VNQSFGRTIRQEDKSIGLRFLALLIFFIIAGLIFVLRLAKLQIIDHQIYKVLASNQHDLRAKLLPQRGRIFVRDRLDGKLYPLAANREAWQVYAVPKNMSDHVRVAHELSAVLGLPDVDLIEQLTRNPEDPYEVIAKDVPYETVQKLKEMRLEGVGFVSYDARMYPEKNMGGQIIGLVTADEQGYLVGKYGLESNYQEYLAGRAGSFFGEKDATGKRIVSADAKFREAVDGSDIVVTLDRAIQYKACERIKKGVLDYEADTGTVIIMDPETGAIMAMCSYPDFDPGNLKEVKDVAVFNNPAVFVSYEPGSVFKAVTLAAGMEAEKINPNTTYVDKGVEEIDDYKIKNSDNKAHGVQTMQQVLEKSLNTGPIFVQRQLGKQLFYEFVQKFGFGQKTNLGLSPEAAGNISSLEKKGDIFAATASFGQGITATPIQLVAAYGAMANQGKLMRPYIVSEIVHPDGTRESIEPQEMGQPISPRTARLISGMLVSVIENGHGQSARLPGYWVAAKTGTAQVAKTGGLGYEAGKINATMLGYAPAEDPAFVMLVKFDNPRKAAWAEECAAPVFGDLAGYVLSYLGVKPDREID